MFVWKDGDLNDEQVAAITESKNVFLVACPGSGKTRTLTYKIAHELSKLDSEKKWVIAITYTNRAAGEIIDRIETMAVRTDHLWIGTIHAFCLEWILKPYGIYHKKLKYGYRIISSHDTERMLTELCRSSPLPRPTFYDCDHYYDSNGLNISCNNKRNNVESVILKYHETLNQNRKIDFELILWYSYQLISRKPSISVLLSKIFSYVLIDEYQDTKEIQYQIFSKILRAGSGNVRAFIVGDPNQAIFTSLGGYAISIDDISRMADTVFEPMQLSLNYRNSEKIVGYFDNFKVYDTEIVSEAEHKKYPSIISFDRTTARENLIIEIARLIRINTKQRGIAPNEICVVGPWWIHLATLTFILNAEKTFKEYFFISEPQKNELDDFDFSVKTPKGDAYLELMEVAPLDLHKTNFDNAPNTYDRYELAEYIVNKIMGKSDKYPSNMEGELFLLLYITDFKFVLSDTTVQILRYFLIEKSPKFDVIFLYTPLDDKNGVVNWLHPIQKEDFQGFSPEIYRGEVINLDPGGFVVTTENKP
ncbi:MAG: UvrD-helicase domain-containing protein [Pseudomonadales bacterium]